MSGMGGNFKKQNFSNLFSDFRVLDIYKCPKPVFGPNGRPKKREKVICDHYDLISVFFSKKSVTITFSAPKSPSFRRATKCGQMLTATFKSCVQKKILRSYYIIITIINFL
jgi:hypothetical protein